MSITTKSPKLKRVRKNGTRSAGSMKVARWGNSLGLRFSREAATQLKLRAGATVSVELGTDSLTIRPQSKRKRWTEGELLAGVTPEVVGGEVDWGSAVGKEAW